MASLLLACGVLVAPPASASCAEISVDGAEVVFAGTAREERLGFTRFDVDGVLAGPDLAPEVWVQTGQGQSPWPGATQVWSSMDAHLDPGARYVVGADRDFRTHSCSVLWVGAATDLARVSGVAARPRPAEAGGALGTYVPYESLAQALAAEGPDAGLRFVRSAFWPY